MDVSADLTELSRTEVAVISAGVKSILDIGRTLEVLETLGVPVVGYGTDEFPSFFSRSSGIAVADARRHPRGGRRPDPAHVGLGLGSGISIANPVPAEDEMARERDRRRHRRRPSPTATRRGITGKDITPYLLGRIVELSDGRSLETNLALVRNNAPPRVAHAVAYQPRTRLTAVGAEWLDDQPHRGRRGHPGGGSVGGMPGAGV